VFDFTQGESAKGSYRVLAAFEEPPPYTTSVLQPEGEAEMAMRLEYKFEDRTGCLSFDGGTPVLTDPDVIELAKRLDPWVCWIGVKIDGKPAYKLVRDGRYGGNTWRRTEPKGETGPAVFTGGPSRV